MTLSAMKSHSINLPQYSFFVLGDSHATAVLNAAEASGTTVAGGVIDSGRNLNVDFHTKTKDDIIFTSPFAQDNYLQLLKAAELQRISDLTVPLFCTFGMNIHFLSSKNFWDGFTVGSGAHARYISQAVIKETVRAQIYGALEFYGDMISMGIEVVSALPPRRTPNLSTASQPEFFLAIEEIAFDLITATGATVIDHRGQTLDRHGQFKPAYNHENPADDVHGNLLFGTEILDRIMQHLSLSKANRTAVAPNLL